MEPSPEFGQENNSLLAAHAISFYEFMDSQPASTNERGQTTRFVEWMTLEGLIIVEQTGENYDIHITTTDKRKTVCNLRKNYHLEGRVQIYDVYIIDNDQEIVIRPMDIQDWEDLYAASQLYAQFNSYWNNLDWRN